MSRAIRAIVWEVLWKNWWAFPVLIMLWGVGGLMAHVHKSPPDAWWAGNPFTSALLAFLVSVVMAFAPFTLMESHGSWRMNSMTTRWCLRPLRTWILVAVPLLLGGSVLTLFMLAWRPIFKEIAPKFDQAYVLVVMLTALTAMQCLAWTTARRPSQFWVGVTLLFPVFWGLQYIRRMGIASESDWLDLRPMLLGGFGAACVALIALTSQVARASRCGAWPGQFDWPWQSPLARSDRVRPRRFSSPTRALLWSDILPRLRAFALGWLLLAVLLTGVNLLMLCLNHPLIRMSPAWIILVATDVLPRWGMIYLAAYGMFLGSQFGTGFHTRLDTFQATRPLTIQTLTVCRLAGLVAGWAMVWLPLLFLWWLHDPGMPAYAPQLNAMLAYVVAMSANVAVGALPIHLLGRVEGFTPLLVASLPCWGAAWLLDSVLRPEEAPDRCWWLVAVLLLVKFAVTGWVLVQAFRSRVVTRNFVFILLLGWAAVVGSLIWLMQTWAAVGLWGVLAIVLLVPLARVSACPLALARNRNR